MLHIEVPEREFFDEGTQEFKTTKSITLQLEHSLVSLSKWESKWCKPFLGKDAKTAVETIDYIRCMTITQRVPVETYAALPEEVYGKIDAYINAPMTATWFNDKQHGPPSREIITSEVIYYQMIAQNIPMECQKWHLNRLLTLIRVCSIKNQPLNKKGGNKRETLNSRNALNQARRNQLNTKG